jgi:uncharacterized protein involved in exopolysaccharide biosynthesis
LQQQLQESQVDEDQLIRAQEVAQETYVTLAHKVEEVQIAADDTSGEVRLASRAAVPERAVSPRKVLNTVVVGTLGLMLAVSGVLAFEWWREDEVSHEAA